MVEIERNRLLERSEIASCQFCSPHMSSLTHFEEQGVGRIDLISIRETKNFVIKPDSLPVHPEGLHMLLIPKEHTYGFALLDTKLGEEAQSLIDGLEDTLSEELALFEHGGVKNGSKVQSIYHAHSHLIGAHDHNIIDYMAGVLEGNGVNFDFHEANHNLVKNIQNLFQGEGYFYIQQNGRCLISHDPNDELPSQLTQTAMSMLLTGEVVNWKEIPQNSRFANLSIERISKLLKRI